MIWFLIFHIAELQDAFSTRNMGPIWINFETCRYFFKLISMVWINNNFPLPWGTLPIDQIEDDLGNINALVMWWKFQHRTYFWNRITCSWNLSKFEDFTLFERKVWNLPLCTDSTAIQKRTLNTFTLERQNIIIMLTWA